MLLWINIDILKENKDEKIEIINSAAKLILKLEIAFLAYVTTAF